MERGERFLAALRLEQPDRVPMFDFLFQQPLYEALIGRRPVAYNGADAVACALALDHDAVWLPFAAPEGYRAVELAEGVYQDEWGTTCRKTPASWPIDAPIAYPIATRADLARYRPPDPTLAGRTAEVAAARALESGLALTGGISGPLTTAWMLMGYERICYALYDDPGMLAQVFAIANEFNKEAARRLVAAGCAAMWVSEDLGDSTRGFFRPDDYRRHILPPFAELVEYVHGLGPPLPSGLGPALPSGLGPPLPIRSAPGKGSGLGVPVLLHACGHVSEYLGELAQTPIAAIHPLQRTAGMDLAMVKAEYGRRWCLIGNIDSSRTLPYGTPQEVAAEVRAAIDVAAPGGGYVLASDHSLHDGIPLANILAMFRTGAEYGRAAYTGL